MLEISKLIGTVCSILDVIDCKRSTSSRLSVFHNNVLMALVVAAPVREIKRSNQFFSNVVPLPIH